jgi:hypothetical protein
MKSREMNRIVEYRVRPVSRHIVTRYESEGDGSSVIGEFPSRDAAMLVAHAFQSGLSTLVTSVPLSDIPALLRNIAEEVDESVKRGIVVLLDKRGKARVYGLGSKVGDPHEILAAGGVALRAIQNS